MSHYSSLMYRMTHLHITVGVFRETIVGVCFFTPDFLLLVNIITN